MVFLPASMRADACHKVLFSSKNFGTSISRHIARAHHIVRPQEGIPRHQLCDLRHCSHHQRLWKPVQRWLACSASMRDNPSDSAASNQPPDDVPDAPSPLAAVAEPDM